MSVVTTQPYSKPYLGYFRLVDKANVFVFADNCDFIDGGIDQNKMIHQVQASSTLINK